MALAEQVGDRHGQLLAHFGVAAARLDEDDHRLLAVGGDGEGGDIAA